MVSFQIYRDNRGEFRFRLKAMNGEIVLTSEGYSTKANCVKAIASVKRNATIGDRYERRTSKNGMNYFTLKAANSQVIGVSEMYSSKSGLENGIYLVKLIAPTATVSDLT